MRNYTAGERAIITLGVATGKTCKEVNHILLQDQTSSGASKRSIPEGSYNMMKKRYLKNLGVPTQVPKWLQNLFEHSTNPKPIADLCFTYSDPNLYQNINKLQIQHYSKENKNGETTDLQPGSKRKDTRRGKYSF
jgi:hypothetical protein